MVGRHAHWMRRGEGRGSGVSSGTALAEMGKLFAQLPKDVGYELTGLSFQEEASGAQAPALYALSIFIIYLCLAALYESWAIPLSVMMVIPLGVIGARATLFGDPGRMLTMVATERELDRSTPASI